MEGDIIPIQIIVTRQLSETENLWLRSLTNKLNRTENAKRLIEDYLGHTDNNLYRSVIDTIMRANQKTFEEVNGMGDIFMEIVQEKFDKKLKEETDKAVQQAVKETVKKEKTARMTERISLIQKKYAKHKPLSVIADELETVPDELVHIYNAISENPDKTAEEVYELVFGKGPQ